jgi:hypothetical protein
MHLVQDRDLWWASVNNVLNTVASVKIESVSVSVEFLDL